MANELVAGALAVEVYAKRDKLRAGLREAEQMVKQSKEKTQRDYASIKMQMDDRLLKLKLSDVEKLHTRLKQRLEEKIKLNYDIKSIETTRQQLSSVENALRGIKKEAESISSGKSNFSNIFGNVKNMAAGVGIGLGVAEIIRLGVESVKLAAKVEGVQTAFDKLNNPNLLSELNKATNETITDFELMRLALTGLDLGATNEQLKIFAEFARFEGVRKGVDTLQVFNDILSGVLKGSTELLDNFGLSLTELNSEVEILAKEKMKKAATELSAVERRMLSVDAATNIMKQRLSEVGNVAKTTAEKFAQLTTSIDNTQVKFGKAIINLSHFSNEILKGYLHSLGGLYKGLIKLTFDIDIDDVATEKAVEKAKQKTQKIIKRKMMLLEDGTKIQVLPGEISVEESKDEFEKNLKNAWKSYYDSMKYEAKDYYDYKKGLIEKEVGEFLKLTGDQVKAEELKVNRLKELGDEYFKWLKENYGVGFSDAIKLAGKSDLFGKDGSLKGTRKVPTELKETEGMPEPQPALEEGEKALSLWENIINAEEEAIQGLSGFWASQVSMFKEANSMLEQFLDTLVQVAIQQAAMAAIGSFADGGTGILGIIGGALGFAKGGTVTNQGGNISIEPYQKFASGVNNFTVPPGFNRDNYLIGVQSGEKVSVTPAGASGNSLSPLLKEVNSMNNRLAARDMNLIETLNTLINVSVNKQLSTKLAGSDIRVSYEKSKKQYNRLS